MTDTPDAKAVLDFYIDTVGIGDDVRGWFCRLCGGDVDPGDGLVDGHIPIVKSTPSGPTEPPEEWEEPCPIAALASELARREAWQKAALAQQKALQACRLLDDREWAEMPVFVAAAKALDAAIAASEGG